MAFGTFKVKIDELGVAEITTAHAALTFVASLCPEVRKKPHWQAAELTLADAHLSNEREIWAALAFEDALIAENWLID